MTAVSPTNTAIFPVGTTIVSVDSATTLTLSQNATATSAAIKLIFESRNTFSGGTILNDGSLTLLSTSTQTYSSSFPPPSNAFGLGTGPITLNGGILNLYGHSLEHPPPRRSLAQRPDRPRRENRHAPLHPRGTYLNDLAGLSGSLTGSGTLNLIVNFSSAAITGDWSAFSGILNVTRPTTAIDDPRFQLGNSLGLPLATVNLDQVTLATLPPRPLKESSSPSAASPAPPTPPPSSPAPKPDSAPSPGRSAHSIPPPPSPEISPPMETRPSASKKSAPAPGRSPAPAPSAPASPSKTAPSPTATNPPTRSAEPAKSPSIRTPPSNSTAARKSSAPPAKSSPAAPSAAPAPSRHPHLHRHHHSHRRHPHARRKRQPRQAKSNSPLPPTSSPSPATSNSPESSNSPPASPAGRHLLITHTGTLTRRKHIHQC
jgi:hypothetical protein